ncbi:unnamed protein product [Urochloa humidicola]
MAAKKGGTVAAAAMVAAVAFFLVVMAARPGEGAVTCAAVDANLLPCVGYVTGKEAVPPGECCAGVKRIRALPSSTAERRQACECVKQAAAKFAGLNANAIASLPTQCGAPLPFPLTLNFDCTTIP